ncbi:T9SS type A sorting domain-containing protein [Chryseobacterium chendengshani]|uniref:fibronectin type III domain-containing protein n=1 Tax=Chryseobacterium sp. LJ668 TaxID=2864040 RepID=UPI001C691CF8|nr:T9SS type A sorting domain-containing protein [Chryseobacterium sp. LJ668]MBW8524126.1 T9SS type A sorting domain-containing protein [Chryseobacterium sp. LJ668]QYK17060.1 T9SS type A sorting domain-containing protein [Chryseobacterium sp. LJ668]
MVQTITISYHLITASNVMGQNASQYSFTQSNGTYTALSTPTVLGSGSALDNQTYSIAPASLSGFSFNFAGTNYTAFTVSANGFIGFGSSLMSGSTYTPISSSTGSNAFVAAYADDLGGLSASTQISWKLEGSSPNRELVIEYKNIRNYNTSGIDLSFQIRLRETTNVINIVYGTMTYTSTTSDASQVGIKSSTTTGHFSNRTTTTNWNSTTAGASNSVTCTVLNTVTMPSSGLTFSYSPPLPCTGTPVAGSVTPTTQNICSGTVPAVLALTGYSTDSGIAFQWEQSSDNSSWTNVTGGSGATTATYTPASFGGALIYYRCKVTCTASTLFSYSNAVTIDNTINPTTQVSGLAFSNITQAGFTSTWTNGNGNRRVVYISNNPITDPTNGSANALTANSIYAGSGQQIVYDGTGTSVAITGLIPGTTYYVKVYEYTRCGSANPYTYYYNTSSGTNASTGSPSAPVAVPWTEAFTTTSLPSSWANTSTWLIGNINTTINDGTTSNYIYYNLYSTATTANFSTATFSPLPANYRLRFNYNLANFNSPFGPPATGSGNFIVAISTNNGSTYTNVATVANNGVAGWQTYTYDLSSYVGQQIKVKLTGNWTSGDYYLSFDNFRIEEIAACDIVTSISSSNITAVGAALNWTSSSSNPSGGYEYEIRTSGAAGSGSTGLVSSGSVGAGILTANISGLSPATFYNAYIRSNCDAQGYSLWSSAAPFTTFCNTPSDASNIVISNITATTLTLSYTTAPVAPTGYMLFQSTSAVAPTLTNGSSYTSGASYTLGGQNYLCLVNNNVGTSFNITSLTSNSRLYYYVFSITNSGCSNSYSPGISSAPVTTCSAAPTSPRVTGITTNGANVSWTASAVGGAFATINYSLELYTDAAYTNQVAGSPYSTGTLLTQALNGLSPSTQYYYRIRSTNGSCGSLATGTFTTLCSTISAPTATQDFSTFSGAAPSPACWSEATGVLATTSTLSGTTSAWLNKTNGFANISSTNMGVSINLYGTKNEWIISPAIDLGSTPGLYILKYKYAVTGYNNTTTQTTLSTHKVSVVISTNGGATWSSANTLKTYTGAGTYSNTGAFETINLSTYYGVVKIAFVATTSSNTPDIDFHIDDFSIEAVPSPIWTGNPASWVNGSPIANLPATIDADYSGPSFTSLNLTVNTGKILDINNGTTVTTANISNNGNINVNDGGNLIQTVGSSYSGSGIFKVNKNGTSLPDRYAFWASPVVGQNLSEIYGSGNTPPYITTYETSTDYFINAASTTGAFGVGYAIKTPSVSNTTFAGNPNNNAQTTAISTLGNGFNLIGNPYPSNLDLNAFYNANSSNIANTLYFWDNTSSNVTTQQGATTTNFGYATYNPVSSTWAPAPNISAVPTDTAAKIGQAFIIKASSGTSVNFNNTMRVSNSAAFFNKNNSNIEGKYWLKLATSYNTNNTLAIVYDQAANNSLDNYDSKAFGNTSDSFYSLVNADQLIIQGRSGFNINDVVPLGNKHFENGTFVISLSQKEGLFSNGQEIYLHDKLQNTYTNLQTSNYSFTSNSGETANRFEIVYKLGTLSTSETQNSDIKIYKDGDDFVVENSKSIQSVQLFDASGRLVQNLKSNEKTIRLKGISQGMYIIKATSEGKEYTRKIIK